LTTTTATRSLSEIARAALRDPSLKGSARTFSKPYLDALLSCQTTSDRYFSDSADMLVRYALENLKTWRGDNARAIKAEFKAHL
jgi:hypothetical protein